jgi:hypothetical protein
MPISVFFSTTALLRVYKNSIGKERKRKGKRKGRGERERSYHML